MDLNLKNKNVLITGASKGIGLACAKEFAAEGCNLHLVSRTEEDLLTAKKQIGDNNDVDITVYPLDLSRSSDVDTLAKKCSNVDILINNAGASAAESLEKLDEAEWLADFHLKVMSAVRLSKLVIPFMRKRGGGCIINASIGGGKAPAAGSLPTSVMRSAGLNLTKSLANEFASEQIRVNAICIGLIKSMQWVRRAGNKDPRELYDEMAKRVPLGRVGEAEEYADLVAFLCSERATFITGTAINLDGGMCPVV